MVVVVVYYVIVRLDATRRFKKRDRDVAHVPDMSQQREGGNCSPISVLDVRWPAQHKIRGVVVEWGEGRKREERMLEDGGCLERAWLQS